MNHTLILASPKEMSWGLRYFLFQSLFLGSFLTLAASLLGIALTPLALNLLFFAVNFVALLGICHSFLRNTISYGLQNLKECLIIVGITLLAHYGISAVLGMVIAAIDPGFANANDNSIVQIGQENYPLMVIGTVLLVPMAEEVMHRGVIFGMFYPRNRVLAYAISMAVFALVHVSGYIGSVEPLTLLLCFVQYLPAGFLLAHAYERSGSLLTPILIHTVINAIAMTVLR